MAPDVYRYILLATISGGFTGALVIWNRKRAHAAGENRLRRLAVLLAGTAASACALAAFTKAFRGHERVYAAMVMILITGWVAVLHSVVPLPVPRSVLRVRTGEFAFLRAPWTGVRLFGAFLRNTPLRHLGGPVYLSDVGRDPQAVLRGIHLAEIVHLWALLFCGPWLVVWGLQGRWMSVVCGLAVHLPLNLYPILHLRYVTWRLEGYAARTRRMQPA
jgi:hypothetical protein